MDKRAAVAAVAIHHEISQGTTYWVQIVSQVSATMKSYNEIEAYKELERITGVKVDFQHPPQGQQATEQFNLMMTSDKLPDVIEYSWAGYPGTGEAIRTVKSSNSMI